MQTHAFECCSHASLLSLTPPYVYMFSRPPTNNVPLCLDFTSLISRSNRIGLLNPWYTLSLSLVLAPSVANLVLLPFFFHSPSCHAGFHRSFFVYCVRIVSEHRLPRAVCINQFWAILHRPVLLLSLYILRSYLSGESLV